MHSVGLDDELGMEDELGVEDGKVDGRNEGKLDSVGLNVGLFVPHGGVR